MRTLTETAFGKLSSTACFYSKIAVYSHDTFGLGNIRRMLAICQHLLEQNPQFSILLITGSPVIHRLPLPTERFDYVKLPCLSRSGAEQYQVKSLGTDLEQTIALRAEMIKTTLAGFQPDLILVDKKPCGVENELKPALEVAPVLCPQTQWVLLLRDILDAPDRTRDIWHKHDYFDVIEKSYSQVLVVGTQEIFDLGCEYAFPPQVKAKMKYCGYLHKSNHSRLKPKSFKGKKTVLVTAGGGQDGERLILSYLKGLKEGPHNEFDSIIVTGPEMEPAAREVIARLAAAVREPVKVHSYTEDMEGLMAAADVVVAMGGYNTICELVSLGKTAVIVPRKRPVQEQWIRAQRFAQRGLLHCLDPDCLNPVDLIAVVRQQLRHLELGHPRPALPRHEWRGLERVSQSIGTLLGSQSWAACQA